MTKILQQNVKPSTYKPISGGRMGTVNLSPKEFYKRFGAPSLCYNENILTHTKREAYKDNKVTVIWTFDTPRGPFEVRDYWWNGEDELSLASNTNKQRLWAISYLKSMGIPVNQTKE